MRTGSNTPGDEKANATIAPTPTSSGHKTVDINDFHVAHAHAHKGVLKKTAKQMGINLEGEMHECKGCSMVEGLRMSIPKKTDNRASKPSKKREGDESDHEDREASSEDS